MSYNYQKALETAGAVVLDFAEFGTYQGDWFAIVNYKDNVGFVKGDYGSCSGCDAFESEFGYKDKDKPDYEQRFKDFGLQYLDLLLTYDEALKYASKNKEWDSDALEMIDWVKKQEKKWFDKEFYDKFNQEVKS